MNAKHHVKLVHEGEYVAEVEVELIYTVEGWSPYLSLDDACKLDDVRNALRRGDAKSASRLAKVYRPTPVSTRHAGLADVRGLRRRRSPCRRRPAHPWRRCAGAG